MKKFVSLLLCAALIFTITGCTGKPEETLANTDPTEPSAIEVPIVPEETEKKAGWRPTCPTSWNRTER